MNFLSHYYFDRSTTNSYHVLGTVLPDLLKNADKTIILHPQLQQHPLGQTNQIYKGWKKHLQVDRHFHNSDFFKIHSHQLKLSLLPAIEGSVVKPFFLGHVALELILDNLLLTAQQLSAQDFYAHLNSCQSEIITDFLSNSGIKETGTFTRFFENFKRHEYLHTYAETQQVAYALKRICMRIWANPFTTRHEEAINDVIVDYRARLQNNFMQIFTDIEQQLKN